MIFEWASFVFFVVIVLYSEPKLNTRIQQQYKYWMFCLNSFVILPTNESFLLQQNDEYDTQWLYALHDALLPFFTCTWFV